MNEQSEKGYVAKGQTASAVQPGERAQVMVQARASSRIDSIVTGDADTAVVQVIAGKERVALGGLSTLSRVGAGRAVIAVVENVGRDARVLEASVVFADEDATSTEGAAPADVLAAPPEAIASEGSVVEQRDPPSPAIEGLDFQAQERNFQSDDAPASPAESAETIPDVDAAMVEGALRACLLRAHVADFERYLADGVALPQVVASAIAWKLEAATLAPNVPPSASEVGLTLDAADAIAVSRSIRALSEPLGSLLDRDGALRTRLARAARLALESPHPTTITLATQEAPVP